MNKNDVAAGIAEIVKQNFPKYKKSVTETTRFAEVTGWDSVGHVAMMLDIEDKFGVTIPEEEIFDLVDVSSVTAKVLASV